MLYGNHDAEFYWEVAQTAFNSELVHIYFGTEVVQGQTNPNFHLAYGGTNGSTTNRFLYIEHGSQYDDFSSFVTVWRPLFRTL